MLSGVITRLKSPDWWGFAILSIFLFVFPILWFPLFHHPYEIIRAAASLFVVAAFLVIIVVGIIRQRKIVVNNKIHVVSSLFFLGYVLINYLIFKGNSFLIIWLSCTVLISIFISLNGYGHKRFHLLSIISYSSIIPNIYGIVQFFGIDFPHSIIARFFGITFPYLEGLYGSQYSYGYRAFSFFSNPDMYGSYLVIVIPVAAYCFYVSCVGKHKIRSFIHGSALILSLSALIASQTRTAMASVIFGILFLPTLYAAVQHYRAKSFSIKTFARRLVIPIAMGASICVMLLASAYYIHRTNPNLGIWSKASLEDRIRIFKTTSRIICRHPLFGVGLGNLEAQKDYDESEKKTNVDAFAHNHHLQTIADYGLAGYALWMIVFINALVTAVKQRTLSSYAMAIVLFLLIMVDGMFSVGMSFQSIALYCWILMGLICVKPVDASEGIVLVKWKPWENIAALISVVTIAILLVNHGRKMMIIDHNLGLGLGTYASGKYGISMYCLGRVAELDPQNTQVLYMLAKIKLSIGDVKGATNILKNLLQKDKGYADANLMLGNVLYGQNDYIGALECFKRHVDLYNTNWDACLGMGMSYNREGKHNDAIAACSIITNNANSVGKDIMVGACRCLSMSYYSIGNSNTALSTINRAEELDATNADIKEQKRQLIDRIKVDGK